MCATSITNGVRTWGQSGQDLEILLNLATVGHAGRIICTRNVLSQRSHCASTLREVTMGTTQVAVDDRLERPPATSGGRRQSPLASLSQGALHRGSDQIISGFEMSVEAAVRQAGFLHQLGYSDTVDAVTAH